MSFRPFVCVSVCVCVCLCVYDGVCVCVTERDFTFFTGEAVHAGEGDHAQNYTNGTQTDQQHPAVPTFRRRTTWRLRTGQGVYGQHTHKHTHTHTQACTHTNAHTHMH